MARVNRVEKCRQSPGKCGGCGETIKKGEQYKWTKPRYGSKKIRCGKCNFRASDLTTSKMGQAYDAQESAIDAINSWDGQDIEDVKQALTDAAESIREVGEEYQSSADAIRDRFSESSTADDCEEKAQALEQWADDIESAADELPDKPDEVQEEDDGDRCEEMDENDELRCTEDAGHEGDHKFDKDNAGTSKDDITSVRGTWIDEVREAALAPLNECPV